MPNRLACVAILLFWTVAAGALVTRDFLPTLLIGPPPDLRSIALADEGPSGPIRWSILASEDGKGKNLRSVGQVITETQKKRDGWVRMTSQAWLDAGELLKYTAIENEANERILVQGSCEIDPSGNLGAFRVGVRQVDSRVEILSIEGRHHKDSLDIAVRSILPVLGFNQSIPYRPREIVQNSLGPLERMPGLQVGQKWESQVISPLSGRVQTCRVDVEAVQHILWGNSTVATLKVVTRMSPISATTWVRASDGLVLRQELPFPDRFKLILERLPDDAQTGPGAPSAVAFGPGEGPAMIELRGVTKAFGARKAVDRLDLEVKAGELFAFLGPNGAGKTTTIKMICGLLTPTAGTVLIGGFPASSQDARQMMAYVPDQPYLYEKLTGREFLRFVSEMYGIDPTAARTKIASLVEIFEMGDFIDELSENYSHGMKQRVVFASALVHDPKVLIVDEPLVGLDPRSARIVKDLFLAQARSGVAVMMSTHLLSIAEELADTIGIIDHGRMLTRGSLAEIREEAQIHGPLEHLFLRLTGGDRPVANPIGAVGELEARS